MSSRTFLGTDGQDGEEMQTTRPKGEATAFMAANQHENEDADSGSGEETSIRTAWLPWKRKVVMSASTAVLCIAAAGILFYSTAVGASDGNHPIFDAPQFEQMLFDQSYPVLGATVHPTTLKDHIRTAIGHLKAKAEQDLPQDQALALKNAKLTAQHWNDLKAMVQGSDKTEVKAAGLLALQVIKQNLFSSEEVIAQKLKEALKPHAYHLIQMRSQMFSPRMDIALGEWAKNHNETHAAWKGLLNSGLALQPIRDGDAPNRRLALGIGGAPVGILSVIFVAIGEILVHVDMFVPGFNLPAWAWRLILTPVKVVTALACTNGANAYCNSIMGAMGLNVLDAAFVLFCDVKLFGTQAANYCATKIASSEMQTEVVDSLSEALGGPDVFHSNKMDKNALR
eukprot:gnl/MRDRNA2_/MRDRNA2_86037_c0_seq1.p1 gnl/MRDRNA2_/MRDRNA2_86037_c0~~gnl/MRDRNA2_/MRDRNA2_86037_c0_seq1.p1  ORF type:complete len:397 (-),score=80.66 gnl/MRDRNA2_/MRDRNA2_86037_c0_seq1:117-1307(-)